MRNWGALFQLTINRKQKTENRKQKTENRKQKTENRKQKTENADLELLVPNRHFLFTVHS
jgi:hypothetical protein